MLPKEFIVWSKACGLLIYILINISHFCIEVEFIQIDSNKGIFNNRNHCFYL